MTAVAEVAGDGVEIKYICPFIKIGCRNPKCPCIHENVLWGYHIQPNADGVYTLDGRHYKRGARLLGERHKEYIISMGMEHFSCAFELRRNIETLNTFINEIIENKDNATANKLLFILRTKFQVWKRMHRKCLEVFNTIDNMNLVCLQKLPKLSVKDHRYVRETMEKKYANIAEIATVLDVCVDYCRVESLLITSRTLILIDAFRLEFKVIKNLAIEYINRLEKFLNYKYDFEFTPDELATLETECGLI